MSVDAVAALNAASVAAGLSSATATGPASPAFDGIVDRIATLNAQLRANDQAVRSMALGERVDLHEIMMDLERTRLTFDLMLQVRNHLLDAYQELTRMQV
jgi:flagellar hook-basal body complex protein FliE